MRCSAPAPIGSLAATLTVLAAGAMTGCETYEVTGPGMHVWQVDSMVKVFEDTRPPRRPETLVLEAARNEVISAQFALRAGEPLKGLEWEVGPLFADDGSTIPPPRARRVGFVPVRRNSDRSALRRAPARFPDPLLEDSRRDVPAFTTQPVWMTLRIPKGAKAGVYTGRAVFHTERQAVILPLSVEVYPAVLPEERTLWVTNWMSLDRKNMERFIDFPWVLTDPRYWQRLSACARNMAAHRQSVILTHLFYLIRFKAGRKGELAFDFTLFDRWVQAFIDAGVIGRIEGGHLCAGPYGTTDHKSAIWVVEKGKAVRRRVSTWSREHEGFLAKFLPALQGHLEEKGWLDMYVQHLMDEPTGKNYHRYKELSAAVRRHGPKLKIVDAVRTGELVGAVDVWVPQLDLYGKELDFYQRRQAAGDEVWFYTCLGPRRPYMNRFIDYDLLKVRLLPWVNARYGATGYLHWGWNYWTRENVFEDVETIDGHSLPPGDSYIVYPGPGGVLDSIRHEAMLEGIQDYELLRLLAAKSPEQAERIMESVVRSFRRYTLDPAEFRAARRRLLAALSE